MIVAATESFGGTADTPVPKKNFGIGRIFAGSARGTRDSRGVGEGAGAVAAAAADDDDDDDNAAAAAATAEVGNDSDEDDEDDSSSPAAVCSSGPLKRRCVRGERGEGRVTGGDSGENSELRPALGLPVKGGVRVSG